MHRALGKGTSKIRGQTEEETLSKERDGSSSEMPFGEWMVVNRDRRRHLRNGRGSWFNSQKTWLYFLLEVIVAKQN